MAWFRAKGNVSIPTRQRRPVLALGEKTTSLVTSGVHQSFRSCSAFGFDHCRRSHGAGGIPGIPVTSVHGTKARLPNRSLGGRFEFSEPIHRDQKVQDDHGTQARLHLWQGSWLTAFDLENAYWHVPIHPCSCKFLAFQAGYVVLQSVVMPFRMSIAPRVFTKLTKKVAPELSVRGVDVLMYLDDWLLIAPSRAEALTIIETTIQVTEDIGF